VTHSARVEAALGPEMDHSSSALWMNWSISAIYRFHASFCVFEHSL